MRRKSSVHMPLTLVVLPLPHYFSFLSLSPQFKLYPFHSLFHVILCCVVLFPSGVHTSLILFPSFLCLSPNLPLLPPFHTLPSICSEHFSANAANTHTHGYLWLYPGSPGMWWYHPQQACGPMAKVWCLLGLLLQGTLHSRTTWLSSFLALRIVYHSILAVCSVLFSLCIFCMVNTVLGFDLGKRNICCVWHKYVSKVKL